MSTTVDKFSGDLHKRPELRKSFNLLKSHASKVANFTLQWQDLEEHFISLDKSIQSKLDLLQQQQQPSSKESELNIQANSEETQLGSKEPQLTATLQSVKTETDCVETQVKKEETLPESSSFNGVPITDSKALLVYLNQRMKDRELVRDLISNALKASADSAKLVLEAVRWFFAPENKEEIDFEVNVIRRSCVLLLEVLMKLKPVIKPEVSKEAMQLALDWNAKVKDQTANSLEVYGFLQLLGAFGLVGEFDNDEILRLVGCVVERKQAPELFKDLGFADKASGFIQKLISENKHVDAVRFIHAFEQLNKFPPVPLLRAHLKFAMKDVRMSCKTAQDFKIQNEALDKQMVALRSIVRCIEEFKLDIEPQYSPENLRKHIDNLKRQKIKERALKAGGSVAQVQHLSGKKRTAPDFKGQPNKQNRNKHPRTAPAEASRNAFFGAPSTVHLIPPSYLRQETIQPSYRQETIQPSYLRQVGLSESRGEEYRISSAGMPGQSYYGTTSTFDSLRGSHHQQAGSFRGQGAEYAAGYYDSVPESHNTLSPGSYAFVGSSDSLRGSHHQQAGSFRGHGAEYAAGYYDSVPESHNTLSPGSYAFVGSSPIARARHLNLTSRDYGLTSPSHAHMNSAVTSYGLGGSSRITSRMSPVAARYATSIAANGRNGQLGSTGSPQLVRNTDRSPNTAMAYAYADPLRGRNYNDQSVSTSSGYAMPSQVPPSIYHL